MASDEQMPPDWAIERAKVLHREAGGCTTPMVHAFAAYIAEHEIAPVDPLLIEAREIVATWLDANPGKQAGRYFPDKFRMGEWDHDASVQQALAALRRGIEIGGSK